MGSVCCINSDENNFISNFSELKYKFREEYKLYLSFLNKLKLDLNSSINFSDNNENNNNTNIIHNKTFYFVPRIWFENWEKRIEIIYKTNKYKSFDCNFEFKNEKKLHKNYYEIVSDELWIQLYKNQLYKLNNVIRNRKTGYICNNLIIFQYSSNKSNSIEIFFFEKDEDLFFTNLLFSFEKCHDHKNECYKLLNLLKSSPIQEILGNIKYDKSDEFKVDRNKMIIYNKTGIIANDIKNFRQTQYMIVINPVHGPNSFENEENPDIYDDRKIEGYTERKNQGKYYEGIIKLNKKDGENTINGYGISEINNNSSKYILNRNISKTIKISKKNNNFSKDNNDNTKTYILSLKNNSLLSNIDKEIEKKISSKMIMSKNEDKSSTNNSKIPSNIFECYDESKINQNFFESILYCLFNIKELTDYLLNNKEKNNNLNSFYNEYLKILDFLYKDHDLISILNKNKTNNIHEITDNDKSSKNLINNCENYNYQKLLRLIIYQNSINIISKIINSLHLELNKYKNNDCNLKKNEYSEEEIGLNKDEIERKNQKYEKFLKDCKEINNSIIFDLFYGIKEIKIICLGCNKVHYKYEIMNIIEISKNKLAKNIKDKNINNNHINIKDCLNNYSEKQTQNDNLLFECYFCKEYQNYSLIYNICKYPEIAILCFLNDDINYNYIKIDLEEKINLSDDEYKLIGIISSEKNNNLEEEKYNAYCYSNKKWFFYDRQKKNNFDFNSNKENLNPIVLFFQKIKKHIDK